MKFSKFNFIHLNLIISTLTNFLKNLNELKKNRINTNRKGASQHGTRFISSHVTRLFTFQTLPFTKLKNCWNEFVGKIQLQSVWRGSMFVQHIRAMEEKKILFHGPALRREPERARARTDGGNAISCVHQTAKKKTLIYKKKVSRFFHQRVKHRRATFRRIKFKSL